MSASVRIAMILVLHSISTTIAQPSSTRVRGEIIDSQTQQCVASRIYVRAADGTWYFPKSMSSEGTAIEYKRQAAPTSLEQHVTLSAHPFIIDLPPGKYTITVERGKEYLPLMKEIAVADPPVDLKLPIVRWIDMAELGWYSGDVHAHRPLADMPNLVLAEDLNVAMPLSHWVTAAETGPVQGNRIAAPAPKPEWIAIDKTHGIYPLNTEYEIFTVGGKSHTLGAVLICGQKTIINQGVPPVRRIAENAHADGAFLDLEKHSWAWTPMIVPLMKVDLFELANNHCWRTDFAFSSWTLDVAPKSMNLELTDKGFTEWGWIEFGLKSYYAYLNCGFRMMPSAGTGAGVHPVPFGFSRVYVNLDGEFTYDKWRKGLLAGHSFVTTGPLMQIQFNGKQAGEVFSFEKSPAIVHVAGPIQRQSSQKDFTAEILVNGSVVRSVALHPERLPALPPEIQTGSLDETISLNESGWIAVRTVERTVDKQIRFAHTAPVFVEISGKPATPKRHEVDHFIDRIERELERHTGVLNADSMDEYKEALAIYRELLERAK